MPASTQPTSPTHLHIPSTRTPSAAGWFSTVKAYGRAFELSTLVETGTYLGDMVEAQRRSFREVWSIELSPTLYGEV